MSENELDQDIKDLRGEIHRLVEAFYQRNGEIIRVNTLSDLIDIEGTEVLATSVEILIQK